MRVFMSVNIRIESIFDGLTVSLYPIGYGCYPWAKGRSRTVGTFMTFDQDLNCLLFESLG
jgi:hypothetical protein